MRLREAAQAVVDKWLTLTNISPLALLKHGKAFANAYEAMIDGLDEYMGDEVAILQTELETEIEIGGDDAGL